MGEYRRHPFGPRWWKPQHKGAYWAWLEEQHPMGATLRQAHKVRVKTGATRIIDVPLSHASNPVRPQDQPMLEARRQAGVWGEEWGARREVVHKGAMRRPRVGERIKALWQEFPTGSRKIREAMRGAHGVRTGFRNPNVILDLVPIPPGIGEGGARKRHIRAARKV